MRSQRVEMITCRGFTWPKRLFVALQNLTMHHKARIIAHVSARSLLWILPCHATFDGFPCINVPV